MDVAVGAPSKYRLVELALRSMIELERSQAGMDVEQQVLSDLSEALLRTSYQSADAVPFGLVEPGYYEPYERLMRTVGYSSVSEIDRIQSFIKQLSNDLAAVATGGHADMLRLVNACAALHQELLNDISSEEMLVVNDWPTTVRDSSVSVDTA